MQIITNSLPGIRDLRGPLVAGYLWLIFVWMLVQPDITRRPRSPVAGSLWDLGQQVGPIGVAIATGFGAYMLGALSQEITTTLGQASKWALRRKKLAGVVDLVGEMLPNRFSLVSWRLSGTVPRVAVRTRPPNRVILQLVEQFNDLPADVWQSLTDDQIASAQEAFTRRLSLDHAALRRELDAPALLLVGDKAQLFAEVDRLRAEGLLRLTVVPPLLATVFLLASSSSWWFAAVPCLLLVARQGRQREQRSKDVIGEAIDHGAIESSSLRDLQSSAEQVLSDLRTNHNSGATSS
jgi:hypothetical protein